MLVVLAILVVLLGILVPSLARVRTAARSAQCLSNTRQWGIALGCYLIDSRNRLPQEGEINIVHDLPPNTPGAIAGTGWGNLYPCAWYNVLPPLTNAAPYRDIYDGTTRHSPNDSLNPITGTRYTNSDIWFCPERLRAYPKNSASGKNSFHYAVNDVLNGSGATNPTAISAYPPDTDYELNRSGRWLRVESFSQPDRTVYLAECDFEYNIVRPATNSHVPCVARTRHGGCSNLLFLDAHAESLPAAALPDPKDCGIHQAPWRTENPTIIWGTWNGQSPS
jgi:prepilin-type processing-associated H-X9-DG protein